MSHHELFFYPVDQLAKLIRSKQVSPVELTRSLLERIEEVNPKINAYVTVCGEAALREAKTAEEEIIKTRYKGPLHGVPLAVKDLYDTTGVKSAYGSIIFKDHVPREDATSIRKLREAGGVIIGKTNTHEFASGVSTNNPHFGATHNPWKHGYVPGGSSGGSGAAMAAGLAFGSTGSDTGGSIRLPAAACGVVGLKPTFGRISCSGIYPMATSMDHPGPITRTVRDAAIMLEAMSGYDPRDPRTLWLPVPEFSKDLEGDLQGWTVGIAPSLYLTPLDEEVEQAWQKAVTMMQELGATVKTLQFQTAQFMAPTIFRTIAAETYIQHRPLYEKNKEKYGKDVAELIESGKSVSTEDYVLAQRNRESIKREFETYFREVDVIVMPTTPTPAFPIATENLRIKGKEIPAGIAWSRFTAIHNLTGMPSLALPSGFSADGLPLSIQIVGPWGEEAKVLQAGYRYEQATNDWRQNRPVL